MGGKKMGLNNDDASVAQTGLKARKIGSVCNRWKLSTLLKRGYTVI